MRLEVCLALTLAGAAVAEPRFEPVQAPAHSYTGGWEHFVGGGLAGFDCDADGLLDLYAAGGSAPAMLMRNMSTDRVAFRAETPKALAVTGVTGAYPLDIDGDGVLDLAVLRVGENMLMKGGPDCTFAPFTGLGFTSGARWTTAFSAMWEGGQALPTLAFGNYVDRTDAKGPFRACDANMLYRPQGDGYRPPAPLVPGYCPLSMLFYDWNRSGQMALRVSNDRHYYVDTGQEQLWEMSPVPRLYGAADGWQDHKLWGMGIAARDLDRDGSTEVFMTSMGDQRLQRLSGSGGPVFEDVPFEMGTTAHRPYLGGDGRPSTGWHVAFGDVQNDGRDDVFIAKGNVEQMPDAAMDDPNNLLIQMADGRFSEAGDTAGLASLHRSRGAVLADFNGDGLLDLAVVNRRAPLEIWQNVTPDAGHWLSVSLSQPGPNTRAVGAWIEVDDGKTVQTREITVGGGHAGGVAGPEHFGLGPVDTVRLRVIWPDGVMSDWADLHADQSISKDRGAGGQN
ncbi:FG-GAP-like repeat-containing protein [Phaeobacter marinintestinus]|uniref:FG-GAP-like repeat-containing protein n=1 Tax=Falsiphaeobacter marinintestinus TaxID=1492905 RepID=UPI0011B63793|nr:FG-GAP-like repeat-containing protein [Phaeobacter marinintestinus]